MRVLLLAMCLLMSVANGSISQQRPKELSWEQWHMKEEHNLDNYDDIAFFELHDLDGSGSWGQKEILSMYGLALENVVGDGSGMGDHDHSKERVTKIERDRVVSSVLELLDRNKDGRVTLEEWQQFRAEKKNLPDFGYGSGHHLDFEQEYEQHHWNKYHKLNDPEVKIKHKEDVEHDLLHHEHEMESTHDQEPEVRKIALKFQSDINLANLMPKFRNQ